MKSEVRKNEISIKPKKTYPYLGKSVTHNLIILFNKPSTGISLGNELHNIGCYSELWNELNFKPLELNEEVVLRNT